MKPRILLVEDEIQLGRALRLNLELEGFEVVHAVDARSALRELLSPTPFNVLLLDVQLPDMTGFELCERLRTSGIFTPVIMLTVRAHPEDRVRGLEAGADDYLTKPFELNELLARLRAQLRRARWNEPTVQHDLRRMFRIGPFEVDLETQRVTGPERDLSLTTLELQLLSYFMAHANRVLTRKELLNAVWGLSGEQETRTVDNFVARLRKVFEEDHTHPRYFISHRGSGYRFVPEGL